MAMAATSQRAVHHFVSPVKAVTAGIWCLFAGATVFLGSRLLCKLARRSHGLWWDDGILLVSWAVLLATNITISVEMTTGYMAKTWDSRMLILIAISSCGTTFGQTWSKTAFAVTLLRITNRRQKTVLWFCIIMLNVFLVLKVFVNWTKYCDQRLFQQDWRIQGFCIDYQVMKNTKAAGNIWNIVMDFVLALFPWIIIWKLDIQKWEKVGLCVSLSLGMVVAIISAMRQRWMDDPTNDDYDDGYYWRQGLSMVWYSSEVAGTIMVQCIPVIRCFMVNHKTTISSQRITDAKDGKGTDQELRLIIRGHCTSRIGKGGNINATEEEFVPRNMFANWKDESFSHISMTASEVDRAIEESRTRPLDPPCNETPITAGTEDKTRPHSS